MREDGFLRRRVRSNRVIGVALAAGAISLLVATPMLSLTPQTAVIVSNVAHRSRFVLLGNNSSLNGTTNSSAAPNSSAISFTPTASSPLPVPATTANWPTYEFAGNRSGFNTGEVTLSPKNASSLHVIWNASLPGPVFGSPSVVNGTVYIGAWDGNEYALSASNGSQLWTHRVGNSTVSGTFLGVENFTGRSYGCPWASPLGVTSSAAVYNGSVYVGGYYDYYRLNATTGSMIWGGTPWNTSIDPRNSSANVSDGYYAWSSPAFFDGKIYVGVSSQCDNPLVVGRVLEMCASNGTIEHYYDPVGNNLGGSVWSSATIDARNNTLWVTTGNGPTGSGLYGESIIALNATTLKLEGAWTVPSGPPDIDFGAGGTLFAATSNRQYVVATNKDGYAYAVNRSNLAAGQVWADQTTTFPGLSTCQPPGQAISPAVFDGRYIYLGSSYTTVNGSQVNGSVRAVFPSNGTYKWQAPTNGTVQAGVASADGVVVDVSRLFTYTADPARPGCYNYHNSPNSWLQVLNATNGRQLYSFHTPYIFAGSPAIADGRIFIGAGLNDTSGWNQLPNHQGHVYAFGIPEGAEATNLRPYDTSSLGAAIYTFGNATGGMPTYNYTWNWGDHSPLGYGRYANHIYTAKSVVTLTLTDAAGTVTTAYWQVVPYLYSCGLYQFCWSAYVISCPSYFSCAATGFTVSPAYLAAYFYDVGSLSVSWNWNFGDGTTPSSAQYPVHTYANHGSYTVTVTATDSEHHQASKSFQVTV